MLVQVQDKNSLLAGDWNDGRTSSFGVAEVVAVPEPSSLVTLVLGAAGLCLLRRKKNRDLIASNVEL